MEKTVIHLEPCVFSSQSPPRHGRHAVDRERSYGFAEIEGRVDDVERCISIEVGRSFLTRWATFSPVRESLQVLGKAEQEGVAASTTDDLDTDGEASFVVDRQGERRLAAEAEWGGEAAKFTRSRFSTERPRNLECARSDQQIMIVPPVLQRLDRHCDCGLCFADLRRGPGGSAQRCFEYAGIEVSVGR